jgi:glycerol-3-phosphate acyltransferase PlsY
MVSLASIIVAVEFLLLTWLLYGHRIALVVFAAVAALLVIARHRTNIARIARGEENKISFSGRGEMSRVLLKEDEPVSGESEE